MTEFAFVYGPLLIYSVYDDFTRVITIGQHMSAPNITSVVIDEHAILIVDINAIGWGFINMNVLNLL